MAETPTVMPQLHMPLQSGSDRILRAMRRSYRSDKFLGILDRVRAAMPDAAITTDIIVGFPGETEEDFAETLRVVEASRFSSAFTFQYSPRPGTPAFDLPDEVPKAVVQERYLRLTALQDRISHEENQAQVGRTVEVLVSEADGRKDDATAPRDGPCRGQPPGAPGPARRRRRRPAPGRPGRRHGDARGAVPPGRRLGADGRHVRRPAHGAPGDAWERRQSGEDEHSHGGAGDSCGTGRPDGPGRARSADDRPALTGVSCPARPAAERRRGGARASSDENICTPVPSPQASSWASWGSVTPGSKSADTSL